MIDQTTTLLNQSVSIDSQTATEQENWLKNTGSLLTAWCDLENYALMGQAKVLYTVKSVWNDRILDEVKGYWNYQFINWAKMYTRTNSKEPSESTINNKIGVYKDWIAEPVIEYPQSVLLDGNKVEIEPMNCNFSKLLTCKHKARKGEMTEKDWQNLVNPSITTRKFEFELNNDNTIQKPDDFRLYEQDGIIYAYENGEKVALLMTLFEDSGSELFRRGLNHIYSSVGIKVNSL